MGWFIADALSEVFQGSDAYAAASRRVWSEFDPDTRTFLPNESMLEPVDREVLANLLLVRFEKECDVSVTPKQRRYSEPACAVIRTAFAGTTLAISDEEIDHVIPFDARVGKRFPVAINHPANLMPAPKRLNSGRREAFLPTYVRGLSAADQALLRARLMVDISLADEHRLDSDLAFRGFLLLRWREICILVLGQIGQSPFASPQQLSDFVDEEIIERLAPV